MYLQFIAGKPGTVDHLLLTTTFTSNDVFYKAALAETVSWDGQRTGTYDVLLQSVNGTKRLTLVKDEGHWRAGEEIEQVGVVQQEVVDLLGEVIGEIHR